MEQKQAFAMQAQSVVVDVPMEVRQPSPQVQMAQKQALAKMLDELALVSASLDAMMEDDNPPSQKVLDEFSLLSGRKERLEEMIEELKRRLLSL